MFRRHRDRRRVCAHDNEYHGGLVRRRTGREPRPSGDGGASRTGRCGRGAVRRLAAGDSGAGVRHGQRGARAGGAGLARRSATARGSASQRAAPLPAGAAAPAAPRPAAGTPAPAQILSVSLSPTVVRSGTTVHAVVRTSPAIVAVHAVVGAAGDQAIDVPRLGSGLFGGSATIPSLPPFVHGAFAVTFVGITAAGSSTQTAVTVQVP